MKSHYLYLYASNTKLDATEESLAALAFKPCTPSEPVSVGWIPARNQDHGALIEIIGDHLVLRAMIETKSVPADVINRKVKAVCDGIEANEGRKPGRKERREISIVVQQDLLAQAFPVQRSCLVLIDTTTNLLTVGASSQGMADHVVSLLARTFDGLSISMVNTQSSPAQLMAAWLCDEAAQDPAFEVGCDTVLAAQDETRATVKFSNHPLDQEKMREHIGQGKTPTQLELVWSGRLSFILKDTLQIKKLNVLDVALAEGDDGDDFDGSITILCTELRGMHADLIRVLGGMVQ